MDNTNFVSAAFPTTAQIEARLAAEARRKSGGLAADYTDLIALERLAIANGVVDQSYPTVRYGWVASYAGHAVFPRGGRFVAATGRTPQRDEGFPQTLGREGYIKYTWAEFTTRAVAPPLRVAPAIAPEDDVREVVAAAIGRNAYGGLVELTPAQYVNGHGQAVYADGRVALESIPIEWRPRAGR